MNHYYGIDTETYSVCGRGLLSIQIYGDHCKKYIGVDEEIIDFEDEEIRNILLDELFYFFETITHDSTFFFYNLQFDFSQMEKYFVTKYELTDEWTLSKGQARILQSPQKVYSVQFRTFDTGRLITFSDLWLITNTSLDNASETFLHDNKIELSNKNFIKTIPTEQEKQYAMKDAELTYHLAMALMDINGFNLLSKITIGSRSLTLFNEIIRSKSGYVDIVGTPCHIPGKPAKDIWSYFDFEETDLPIFEKYLRNSLRGGVCQAFQTGIFSDCIHLDLNSAHPSQMVKLIPYGKVLYEKPSSTSIAVVFPTGEFRLKKDGLKIMQFSNNADCLRYRLDEKLLPGYYIPSFLLDGSYGIWEHEYQQILTQYDFEGTEKRIYFRTRKDPRLSAMINALYDGKNNSEGAQRTVYKYLQNSLYGKFLTKGEGESIGYEYDGEKVHRKTIPDIGRKQVALPLGSWIATSTRVTLIDSALKVPRENLLYCDTDSLIFKKYDGWEKDFSIGPRLGQWKIESRPSRVNVVGPKTYQEQIDGKTYTKCAGLSHKVSDSIPFGDLCEGYKTYRLKAERDPETLAITLTERPFVVTSKPQPYLGGH